MSLSSTPRDARYARRDIFGNVRLALCMSGCSSGLCKLDWSTAFSKFRWKADLAACLEDGVVMRNTASTAEPLAAVILTTVWGMVRGLLRLTYLEHVSVEYQRRIMLQISSKTPLILFSSHSWSPDVAYEWRSCVMSRSSIGAGLGGMLINGYVADLVPND